MRGDGWCLRIRSLLGNPSRGLFESPAAAFELQQMAVMHQPIEEQSGDDHIAAQRWSVLQGSMEVTTVEDFS